ncbi:MAG: MAPEG family protein [Halioglobus sp.]
MDMPAIAQLTVTPLYAALLGLLFLPYTMRVGFYRLSSEIFIGNGDDPELLRRVRGQGNFVETVPLALILILTMELCGAGNTWLHAMGALLVFGRFSHYLGLTELGPKRLRPVGMFSTMGVYLVSSGWILVNTL